MQNISSVACHCIGPGFRTSGHVSLVSPGRHRREPGAWQNVQRRLFYGTVLSGETLHNMTASCKRTCEEPCSAYEVLGHWSMALL